MADKIHFVTIIIPGIWFFTLLPWNVICIQVFLFRREYNVEKLFLKKQSFALNPFLRTFQGALKNESMIDLKNEFWLEKGKVQKRAIAWSGMTAVRRLKPGKKMGQKFGNWWAWRLIRGKSEADQKAYYTRLIQRTLLAKSRYCMDRPSEPCCTRDKLVSDFNPPRDLLEARARPLRYSAMLRGARLA